MSEQAVSDVAAQLLNLKGRFFGGGRGYHQGPGTNLEALR